ncbi:hypothetical protein L1887_41843 [Cichorium endivia]|nr:hypothetical protein L1887_41843 [Cichorium endivia]
MMVDRGKLENLTDRGKSESPNNELIGKPESQRTSEALSNQRSNGKCVGFVAQGAEPIRLGSPIVLVLALFSFVMYIPIVTAGSFIDDRIIIHHQFIIESIIDFRLFSLHHRSIYVCSIISVQFPFRFLPLQSAFDRTSSSRSIISVRAAASSR